VIVLTHGDLDHTGGADELRRRLGVEVWAPAGDRELVEHRLHGRGLLPTLVRVLSRARPPQVDHWFGPDDTVAGLQVIATPGHTPGHVSFRRRDLLIAGDAVRTGERFRLPPRLMNTDHQQAIRSVVPLADLAGSISPSAATEPPPVGDERALGRCNEGVIAGAEVMSWASQRDGSAEGHARRNGRAILASSSTIDGVKSMPNTSSITHVHPCTK
jgi:glyoxylase-like metal-dependent hydrolase (beta-lactamase superfamily II)